jgi:dUTPase
MQSIELKILDERIRPYLPSYATPGSAGLDLRACVDDRLVISPGDANSSRPAFRSTSAIPVSRR